MRYIEHKLNQEVINEVRKEESIKKEETPALDNNNKENEVKKNHLASVAVAVGAGAAAGGTALALGASTSVTIGAAVAASAVGLLASEKYNEQLCKKASDLGAKHAEQLGKAWGWMRSKFSRKQ